MKKLTFEIRSPAHQQNAIHAVQQILPDPTKPIVVTISNAAKAVVRPDFVDIDIRFDQFR
ncbi:recombination protein NinB, partial [Escherichia coli]|uniref:recombination protein NinB n=1 Tax=Escherichia coli TaxID=562 RepID=UPI003B67F768